MSIIVCKVKCLIGEILIEGICIFKDNNKDFWVNILMQ
ncbi:hypothetical protein EMUCRT_0702 [Ehrlichia cf. muris str. EmCRT]|uniref:Uncharacterized protein n=1 Tax=Ehrlichia cf. muris str. EmCRT TaxID=1359167 RepID=A0A0F3NDB9_9RICK|nr:hypothetical protein EMUCRT_0702 [Ehrlichia cf. muris str. EmCRT]